MQLTAPIRLVAFDLDDTLAPSKSPLPAQIAELLVDLLERVPVCVISGGRFQQFERQLLGGLQVPDALAPRLHLMPTCGAQYYRWNGEEFAQVYSRSLPTEQRAEAMEVLEREARRLGLWEANTWGPALEDRGSQITFSALGQRAPVEAKAAWDPTGEKKGRLRDAVAPLLPELEVRSGGSTSVDITLKGIDKAYGMSELVTLTGVPLRDMFFVGDRLDEGGNDRPVLDLGVRCFEVEGWQHTAQFLADELIPALVAQ